IALLASSAQPDRNPDHAEYARVHLRCDHAGSKDPPQKRSACGGRFDQAPRSDRSNVPPVRSASSTFARSTTPGDRIRRINDRVIALPTICAERQAYSVPKYAVAAQL